MSLLRFLRNFIPKFAKVINEIANIHFRSVLPISHHRDCARYVVPFEILMADSIEAESSRSEVVLDEKFSADSSEWDNHLVPLFKSQLHNMVKKNLIFEKMAFWVIIHIDQLDVVLIDRTLSALDRIDATKNILIHRLILSKIQSSKIAEILRTSGRTVESYSFGESRLNLIAQIPANDFILWAKIGDAPRLEFSTSMMLYAKSPINLITFDSYFHGENRIYPIYMPGKNPAYILNSDCIFSRFVVRAHVIQTYGGCNDAVPLIEIVRCWIEASSNRSLIREWTHIQLPIYHLNLDVKDVISQRQAIVQGSVSYRGIKVNRDIRYAKVSVVICTKDKGHLLLQLVRNCLSVIDNRICEVIVVSNNTENFYAIDTLASFADDSRVKILKYNLPFNFSAQSNMGAKIASGDYILMMNDDIVPVNAKWLEYLLEPFQDEAVGISGPLLLYANESSQHAGMFLGYNACAGHTLRHSILPDQDYMFYASAPREVSSITGAVMLISRSCFNDLNGFDELLASFLQDVDLCLRAKGSGFRIIYIPSSRLIHMESVSVVDSIDDPDVIDLRGREHAYFFKRWGKTILNDDFHNRNFNLRDESLKSIDYRK